VTCPVAHNFPGSRRYDLRPATTIGGQLVTAAAAAAAFPKAGETVNEISADRKVRKDKKKKENQKKER
jgi:hypothetical protein